MNKKKLISIFAAACISLPGITNSISFASTEDNSFNKQNEEIAYTELKDTNFFCNANLNQSNDMIGLFELERLSKKSDLITIADTSHSNIEIKNFIADINTIRKLHDIGVGEILIEIQSEMQDLFDQYYKKEIERAEFLEKFKSKIILNTGRTSNKEKINEHYNYFANLIEQSRKYNIKISAIDSKDSIPKMDSLLSVVIPALFTVGVEKLPEYRAEFTTEQYKRVTDYLSELSRLRNNDTDLAIRVKDKVDQNIEIGKKTLIIYGSYHFSKKNELGLDEQLNKLGVSYKVMDVYTSLAVYNIHALKSLKENKVTNGIDSSFLLKEGCINQNVKNAMNNTKLANKSNPS